MRGWEWRYIRQKTIEVVDGTQFSYVPHGRITRHDSIDELCISSLTRSTNTELPHVSI